MNVSVPRRLGATIAAIAPVAVAIACATPGTAFAKGSQTQCSGDAVFGQGASVESVAQKEVWDPQFNISADKFACNGSQGTKGTPTVTYTNTGSGQGLESWGEFGKVTPNYGPMNAFIGTSETPTAAVLAEIEGHETTPTPEQLETVPVVQLAIAVIVNLPANCTATSTAAPGRLALNNSTLEGIFNGSITKWSQIKDGGDALSGTGCNAESPIVPVVRQDQAGTTHILKRYLGLVDPAALETAKGPHSWDELSEASLNTTWPTALPVVRPEKKGDAEEAAKVASTPGSIGYGNLAEIRATGRFSRAGVGGAGTASFWVEIQNAEKKGKAGYQDPASNGDVEAVGNANCKKTMYTNGTNPFPPPAVTEPWNEVTTSLSEKSYTLCGFTYVLTTKKYSLFTGTTPAEAETVKDFLQYVTDKKGGQAAIGANHDYFALPKLLASEAAVGAGQIAF
jgi:ABC-type phosphate transport system substrate-binding protein